MRGEKHIKSYNKLQFIRFLLIVVLLLILFHTSEIQALNIEFKNYNMINFGEINPRKENVKDNVPPDGLIVKCTASSGTPGWTLNIKLENPLTHESNPASTIPNMNFKWYVESTTGSISNIVPGVNNDVEFRTYDSVIYNGSAGEEQTEIKMKFKLELPTALQWGTYDTHNGKIVFTLTE